jgi:dTDP-4-dehydrorhamnose 3,5-epimerase
VEVIETRLDGVVIVEPAVFGDDRGFFMEAWNQRVFDAAVGPVCFVQDNQSRSVYGVLRGLHYQLNPAQGKLVRVAIGSVFDVAVDVRRRSPQFGQWVGVELSATNRRQLWIPPGFAHGFVVLSESADLLYKATEYYDPPSDRSILWNDPEIGVEWPIEDLEPLLSEKDRTAVPLARADLYD